jgi:hypothetical protein
VRALVGVLASAVVAGSALTASAEPETSACGWKLVGSDSFRLPGGLTRSQGVTTDGNGWVFSWQGGLERTDGAYLTQAVGTLPPDIALQPQVNPDGTNHVGGNHIGDIDVYDGKVYAPVEDGGQNLEVTTLNDPEYQHPYIALYDAKTLAYTGVHYALDKGIHEAGVPWVAVDPRRKQVYTAEWDMPHDRLNVFDLQMRFERFLPLVYPADLGPGFHLSRIQGAKVDGHTMYASRDDDRKTVFSIDLRSGEVRRLFSLDPGVPAELEGLAVRATPDGARLHVIIILHNDIDASGDFTNIQAVLEHYAPVSKRDC